MKENVISTEEFTSAAQEACEAAVAAGADQAEIFLQRDRSIVVSVENNRVRSCEEKDDSGFCARAVRNGAVGYARGQGLSAKSLIAAARNAAANAAAAQPDPDFVTLPLPGEVSPPGGLYDPLIAALSPSELTANAIECIATALDANSAVSLKADFSATAGCCSIINSLGIALSEEYTFADAGMFAIIRNGDDVGSYYDFTRGRRLIDLKPRAALAKATTRAAESFLGACKIPTDAMPVVLGPLAAFSFIQSVIEAAGAESVLRGRSFLAGKRGEKISSGALTVIEDPLAPAGLSSSGFDAEGVPRARRELISSGTLTTYLHNATTAGWAKEPLTGHAERAGYLSGISTGITNMRIVPGEKSKNELISSIKRGLYIDMGSLSPNSVSGALSGTVDYGFLIENGQLACPVSNAMAGGMVFDILAAIEAVSSDYREEPGNIMPSLLIGKLSIAGS